MQVVYLGICCGPGVLSLMFYLLLIIYCCRCFFYSLLSIFLFLSSFVLFIVCLCYPALLYVVGVPHTFPPCEIWVWGKYGEFCCYLVGTSLILGFMHACFIESKRYALPSVFICLLCSVSFPICFHAQCFY